MRVETAPAGLELGQLALPALVGRAAELDQLLEAVTGPPAVVVVEGEAGVGKTRLVGQMLLAPELRGRRTLVGSCQPFREPLPFGRSRMAAGLQGQCPWVGPRGRERGLERPPGARPGEERVRPSPPPGRKQLVVQVPPLSAKQEAPLLEIGVGLRHEPEA